MTIRKFLYVNDDGDYQESPGAPETTDLAAAITTVADSGNLFVATNVEDALAELYNLIIANTGPLYTVGTGGVAKGDLVYISAADTVRKATEANSNGFGLAAETKLAGQQVRVYDNDRILTGVLSGAVAGTKYYWSNSGLTITPPTGGASNVYKVGWAKNSTDLHVEVELVVKKNP
jgi:hypothetical protein